MVPGFIHGLSEVFLCRVYMLSCVFYLIISHLFSHECQTCDEHFAALEQQMLPNE